MAQQGKEYTTEQKEIIFESLRPYLELGFSRARACKIIGLDDSTLSKWLSNDEALSIKIQSWENAMNKLALQNIRDAMIKEGEEQKADTAKWYAERKMKDEFSTKSETDLNVKELPKPIMDITDVRSNNSN